MAIKHQRLNITARWLHRCPVCGSWFALRIENKYKSFTGVQNDYVCSHCGAKVHDWKPSAAVKF